MMQEIQDKAVVVAVPADSSARSLNFATGHSEDVDISETLNLPTRQEL